jgi:hypothetical protein
MSVVFPTSELKPLIATIAGRFIISFNYSKKLGQKLTTLNRSMSKLDITRPYRMCKEWIAVRGQKSEVRRQRSEVRGQKSEVRSQRSKVRWLTSPAVDGVSEYLISESLTSESLISGL